MVSGRMPNTLKLTQASVVMVRQTTSFSTASTTKKQAQRTVRMRQPVSLRLRTVPSSRFRTLRRSARLVNSTVANRRLTKVGFSLMNRSFSSHKVSPPNSITKKQVTSGMIGSLRSRCQDTSTDAAVAAMKAPVPIMMPACELVMKKTASGPASIRSRVNWFTALHIAASRRVLKRNPQPGGTINNQSGRSARPAVAVVAIRTRPMVAAHAGTMTGAARTMPHEVLRHLVGGLLLLRREGAVEFVQRGAALPDLFKMRRRHLFHELGALGQRFRHLRLGRIGAPLLQRAVAVLHGGDELGPRGALRIGDLQLGFGESQRAGKPGFVILAHPLEARTGATRTTGGTATGTTWATLGEHRDRGDQQGTKCHGRQNGTLHHRLHLFVHPKRECPLR